MENKTSIPSTRIVNGNSVIQWFGYWPDFHDFEVVRVEMDRSGPLITMEVYAFHTLSKTDENGYFKRSKECIITLKFNDISDVVLEDFNQQNVLSSLIFEDKGDFLKTKLSSSFGLCGYIVSKNMEIISIKPASERK